MAEWPPYSPYPPLPVPPSPTPAPVPTPYPSPTQPPLPAPLPPASTDPQTWAEPGALPPLSGVGGFRPHLFLQLTNPETALKTGLYVESVSAHNDQGPLANEGVFVAHFSQADNGHDASGITGVEYGNGNALSLMKQTKIRPAGLPVLEAPISRQYGFCLEANVIGQGTAIITGTDEGVALAAGVGNIPKAEGVLVYPRATGDLLDQRVAIRVTKNQDDLVDTNNDAFRVMMDGTVTIPRLAGPGKAMLCVDETGTLYRGPAV